MKKPNLPKFMKDVAAVTSKHKPEILQGLGIAGMITTTVLAVKATPKALQLIEDAKKEAHKDELTPVETVKAAWKPYVPAAVTGVVSVGCLIGASSVSARRTAALTTAYQLSTSALSEYKEKVVETIGEKKEQAIRDKVAQKKVDDHPVSKNEVVVIGNGDVLFLEPVSMRYFTSDIETVRRVINDINHRLTIGMEEYISLSEFYDAIGLKHTSNSDDLGWNLGRDGLIDVRFPATTTDEGKPCLMLEYQVEPRYDYHKLM